MTGVESAHSKVPVRSRKSILLANSDMTYRGGTQAWIRQMASTLQSHHDVDVFSLEGAPLEFTAFRPEKYYDIALVNHWTTAQALRGARIHTRITTVHGVIPFEEVPVLGSDAYVSVSEAVQNHIPYRSMVIRNPIDFAHFSPDPARLMSPVPRRVAFVSNRQGDALPILREACDRAGLELRVVGRETSVEDPREVYLWADVVVGIARVAMEALACGRNVLCFDYQGCHGMATRERLPTLWQSNFGGHRPGVWPTADEVARALLEGYDPRRTLRSALLAEHDPERVARSYLRLAETVGSQRVARLVRAAPRQVMSPKITRMVAAIRRRPSEVRLAS
ncbi:conserved hypothetical protein [Micrococcus luteus]|nr:conserved hypothetical protein [Micrococcus luteus]